MTVSNRIIKLIYKVPFSLKNTPKFSLRKLVVALTFRYDNVDVYMENTNFGEKLGGSRNDSVRIN